MSKGPHNSRELPTSTPLPGKGNTELILRIPTDTIAKYQYMLLRQASNDPSLGLVRHLSVEDSAGREAATESYDR